jgi:hypothetical protein
MQPERDRGGPLVVGYRQPRLTDATAWGGLDQLDGGPWGEHSSVGSCWSASLAAANASWCRPRALHKTAMAWRARAWPRSFSQPPRLPYATLHVGESSGHDVGVDNSGEIMSVFGSHLRSTAGRRAALGKCPLGATKHRTQFTLTLTQVFRESARRWVLPRCVSWAWGCRRCTWARCARWSAPAARAPIHAHPAGRRRPRPAGRRRRPRAHHPHLAVTGRTAVARRARTNVLPRWRARSECLRRMAGLTGGSVKGSARGTAGPGVRPCCPLRPRRRRA